MRVRNWFYLEDRKTGESRDVIIDGQCTQNDARRAIGGVWLDAERVVCHGPCPIRVRS
jgi:hypothetical protein